MKAKEFVRKGIVHMLSVLMVLSALCVGLVYSGAMTVSEAHAAGLDIDKDASVWIGKSVASNAGEGLKYTGNTKWKVLKADDNDGDGKTDKVLVISDVLWKGNGSDASAAVQFNADVSKGNTWKGSDAQAWCNKIYEKVLSSSDAIIPNEDGDKVFFLSEDEVKTYFEDSNDARKAALDGSSACYWLRTLDTDASKAKFVSFAGSVGQTPVNSTTLANLYEIAARPAFWVDLSKATRKSNQNGTLTVHFLEKTEAKEATCEDTGNNEYFTCSVCGTVFKDSNASVITDPQNMVTKAKGHDYKFKDFTWTKSGDTYTATANYVCANDSSHTKTVPATVTEAEQAATCEEDGNRTFTATVDADSSIDKKEHTDTKEETIDKLGHDWGEWKTITESTCTMKGNKERVCKNDLTHIETQEIEKKDHKLSKTEAVAATCDAAGSIDYWTCSECNKLFSDADGTKEIKEADTVVAALGHDWGAWTNSDASQHKRVCSHDSSHVEKEDHAWDAGKVTKEATEDAEGVKTYKCTVCQATKTESIPKKDKTETKSETKPETKPATKPETKPATKPETKPQTKPEAKTTTKPAPAVRAPGKPSVSTVETYRKKIMTVKWKKVSGASSYVVAYRKVGAAKWTTKKTTKTAIQLTKQKDKGLYQYKVAAIKKANGKTVQGKYSKISYRYINAKTPKLKAKSKAITVTWNKDKHVTRYKVQYALKKNMKGAKTRYVSGTKNAVTIKDLKKGQKYYVKLIPLKNNKGTEYVGQYVIRSVKTK